MSGGSCLAIDIGGTKIDLGLVGDDGAIGQTGRLATPHQDDPEVLFALLAAACRELVAASPTGPTVVGVGCGGPMDHAAGLVSPLNIPAWRDFPLASRLETELGVPAAVDNDAKALALGEGWLGAARGSSSYLAMVVSTGVGGGIVLDGRLLEGRLGNAGHIGHLIVEPGGRLCACGALGCLEAEASGTAIEARTGRPAREADEPIIKRTGALVGRAVASVVTLLDLDLCVVAGSVALGFGSPFFAAAQRSLELSTGLSYTEGARIIPAGLGERSPLLGAAAVGFLATGRLEVVS